MFAGLVRLHVLHHAVAEPIYGQGIAAELARHGYRLGPGTLHPLLHGLEAKGYLRASMGREGRHARRMYRATGKGRRALEDAKGQVRELFGELFENPVGSGKR